jgi:hypothetical protein
VHHVHLLNITSVTAEVLESSVLRIKLLLPGSIKINSIQEIRNGCRVYLVDDARNHAFSLLLAPVINASGRFRRGKVHALNTSLIRIGHGVSEITVQSEILIDGDKIGNVYGCLLVKFASRKHQRLITVVEFLHAHALATDCLQNLLLSLAVGTIRKHSHQIGDAHWRNHLRIHAADLLIESESEIVVLLHDVLLSL